ncbi:MAG: ParB/RepB/Spo0J family partition protein [Chthonomonadetes bacterium]|nr:ParB/RepB/Spo0J family partition protein [Chthonomonadetes bacterium]
MAVEVRMIPVSQIVEDPEQPRRDMDPESLQGLADSLRQHGMLQPIVVKPLHNVNMYQIVIGERRWRAAQMAGLFEIPCIVREVDPEEALTDQLIENLQREDLRPIDRARALQIAKTKLGLSNRDLASRLGISERMVGYMLELLDLPEEIAEQVVSRPNRPAEGAITEKHARFLKQLNEMPEVQAQVAEKIKSDRLNTDETAKLVRAIRMSPERAEELLRGSAPDWAEWTSPELPPLPEEEPQATATIVPPSAPPSTAPVPTMTSHPADTVRRAIELLGELEPAQMTPEQRVETVEVLRSLLIVAETLIDQLMEE